MINIMSLWKKSNQIPVVGTKIFSKFLGLYIPYTGSVGAEVVELKAGKSVVKLQDRRHVRNHLDSIHAVALMNIGELSTGLLMAASIPEGYRFILKNFEISYFKKARGRIFASAEWPLPEKFEDKQDCVVKSVIRNEMDPKAEILCEVKATWRVSKSHEISK